MIRDWARYKDASGKMLWISINVIITKIGGRWKYRRLYEGKWFGNCKTLKDAMEEASVLYAS